MVHEMTLIVVVLAVILTQEAEEVLTLGIVDHQAVLAQSDRVERLLELAGLQELMVMEDMTMDIAFQH